MWDKISEDNQQCGMERLDPNLFLYLRQTAFVYIVAVIHGSRDLSGMENKPWDVG